MIDDIQDQNAAAFNRVLALIPENLHALTCKTANALSMTALAASWVLGLAMIPLMILAMTGVLH